MMQYVLDVNYFYIVMFVFIMISTGLIKEYKLFDDIYYWLQTKIPNKKALLAITSSLLGILPIQGRIIVSTPLLDVMASRNVEKRKKFGILNYLCTHHYYLWSPMEKSVLIPMAALGLSYLQILSYFWPLLAVMLIYTIWFLYKNIDESDIYIASVNKTPHKFKIYPLLALLAGILLIVFNVTNLCVLFIGLAAFYIFYTKCYNFKKLMSYIDWKMLIILFFVVLMSKIVTVNADKIMNILQTQISATTYLPNPLIIMFVGAISWFVSFLLGSSGKFAGIVAMLTSLFGLPYLPLFMAIEFSGYNMAFLTHKCIPITNEYFKTNVGEFLAYITPMCFIMIVVGIFMLFV